MEHFTEQLKTAHSSSTDRYLQVDCILYHIMNFNRSEILQSTYTEHKGNKFEILPEFRQ